MARYALLIDHDYCTGCHTCEVACQQEHNYPPGTNGVVVNEYEYIAIKDQSGRLLNATVIAVDKERDLALLKPQLGRLGHAAPRRDGRNWR